MILRRVLVFLLLLPIIAPAHHSFAEYDRTALHELEGELLAVQWRNPHVMFTLRTEDANGEARNWALETSAVYVLERAGIDGDMFSAGQRVTVAGFTSNRRALAMNVSNMLLPDGREVLFYPNSRIRWSSETSGGPWLEQPVNRGRDDIFRLWSVADFDAYLAAVNSVEIELSADAQAKIPDSPPFDPCEPQGMPGTMQTPLPIQFIDRGDHIDLQLTTFSILRRIDLDPSVDETAVAPTDLGYSRGRWMGDTLEVRTTRIGWPYLDDAGRPQTENVEVVEEFTLTDDGGRLRYTQTVRDPGSLLEPMVVSWDFVDIGEREIDPVRCE